MQHWQNVPRQSTPTILRTECGQGTGEHHQKKTQQPNDCAGGLKGRWIMDQELKELLEKAKTVKQSDEELEEHRIALAAANGTVTDSRITVDTMKATRTIMKAAEKARE